MNRPGDWNTLLKGVCLQPFLSFNWVNASLITCPHVSLPKYSSVSPCLFFFFNFNKFSPAPQTYLFLIEGKLLHNFVLASAIHQHDSAIGIHVSPPSLTSLLSPTPSHPSRLLQSLGWVPWDIQQIPIHWTKQNFFTFCYVLLSNSSSWQRLGWTLTAGSPQASHSTPSYSLSACLLFPLFSFSIVHLTEYPVGGRTTQRRALPSNFETLQFVYFGWNILLEEKEPRTHADQLFIIIILLVVVLVLLFWYCSLCVF